MSCEPSAIKVPVRGHRRGVPSTASLSVLLGSLLSVRCRFEQVSRRVERPVTRSYARDRAALSRAHSSALPSKSSPDRAPPRTVAVTGRARATAPRSPITIAAAAGACAFTTAVVRPHCQYATAPQFRCERHERISCAPSWRAPTASRVVRVPSTSSAGRAGVPRAPPPSRTRCPDRVVVVDSCLTSNHHTLRAPPPNVPPASKARA